MEKLNPHSSKHAKSTNNFKRSPCNHFSIRGYVAAMRQKNWKKTSPFLPDKPEEQPSPSLPLPPLVVPKFRNWLCGPCVEQVEAEANDKKEQRDLISNEIQEAPMSNNTSPRVEIDLNKPIEIDSDDDDSDSDPISTNNEKQNDAQLVVAKKTDHETSLEDNLNQNEPNIPSSEEFPSPVEGVVNTNEKCSEGNVVSDMELDTSKKNNLNHEVPISPSLEVCPDPIQEVMHTIESGSEVNVVSNMELDPINVNNMDKSSSEVRNEGRPVFEDKQCPTKLRTSKAIIMREAEVAAEDNVIEHITEQVPLSPIAEEDNVIEHITEQVPLSPIAEEDNVPAGNMDNNDENNHVLDQRPKRSRRKQRKMRLLDEIFRENDEANNKQITAETQSPSNVPSQTQPTIPDKVVIVEAEKKVTKRGRGRKRKSPAMAKKSKDVDVSLKRVEPEVQNIKKNAAKGKEKVLIKSNEDLDNDKMIEDSLALKEAENVPNMLVSTTIPPAPNGERLEERVQLSLNGPSSGLICNNRSFPRPEFQLPFPWPFQEGTSTWRPRRRRGGGGGGINFFRQQSYPSKHSVHATSRKGKEVLIEEIDEDLQEIDEEIDEDKSKDVSAECSEPSNMENFFGLTQEDDDKSNQNPEDDIIMEVTEVTSQYVVDEAAMEVAEIMITSLPANCILKDRPQEQNSEAIIEEKTNDTTTRVENNVIPSNGNLIDYPSFGNPFGLNNLYSTQSPYKFAVSPTKDTTNNFGLSQTSLFNGGISSSSNPTLHVHEHDNNPNFPIHSGKSMSLNNVFFRYDEKLKKIVSHPPSNIKDIPMQGRKLGLDLNKPFSDDTREPERVNTGDGTLSKKSVEASPNQRQIFDLNSNEPTPNMNNDSLILYSAGKKSSSTSEMQRRTLYAGQCSNVKLDNGNGSSKKSFKPFEGEKVTVPINDGNMSMFRNGKMIGSASTPFTLNGKLFGWLHCETETPLSVPLNTAIIESSCEINKNPADFSVPEPGNPYMNSDGGGEEEDVEAEKNAPKKRHGSASQKRKRNSKKR